MVGSPHWMPPEIILKAPYNEKVDVWSMGVTLLQLIDPKGFDLGGTFNVCHSHILSADVSRTDEIP